MKQETTNYIIKVLWPPHCQIRGLKVLEERADIVNEMNGMRTKIENFLKASCSGYFKVSDEYNMKGFNVGMNIGECAGQTVMWPHIHFIPRHHGDAKHLGGIRFAHPGADHREHY